MKIHHLGIVVSDVHEALVALGLDRSCIVESVFDPGQCNNLHMIYLKENDLWLELVEPTSPQSSTATFARRHGLGLHHIAMASEDLLVTEAAYSCRVGNFVLGRYRISVQSFGGRIRTLFVACKGLLLEFIGHERNDA